MLAEGESGNVAPMDEPGGAMGATTAAREVRYLASPWMGKGFPASPEQVPSPASPETHQPVRPRPPEATYIA